MRNRISPLGWANVWHLGRYGSLLLLRKVLRYCEPPAAAFYLALIGVEYDGVVSCVELLLKDVTEITNHQKNVSETMPKFRSLLPTQVIVTQISQFLWTQNLTHFVLWTEPQCRQQFFHSSIQGAGSAHAIDPGHRTLKRHHVGGLKPGPLLWVATFKERACAVAGEVIKVVDVNVRKVHLLDCRCCCCCAFRCCRSLVVLLAMMVGVVSQVGPPMSNRSLSRRPDNTLFSCRRTGSCSSDGCGCDGQTCWTRCEHRRRWSCVAAVVAAAAVTEVGGGERRKSWSEFRQSQESWWRERWLGSWEKGTGPAIDLGHGQMIETPTVVTAAESLCCCGQEVWPSPALDSRLGRGFGRANVGSR